MVLNLNNFSVGNIFRGSIKTFYGILVVGVIEIVATPLVTALGITGNYLAAWYGARIITYPIVLFYLPLREFFKAGG